MARTHDYSIAASKRARARFSSRIHKRLQHKLRKGFEVMGKGDNLSLRSAANNHSKVPYSSFIYNWNRRTVEHDLYFPTDLTEGEEPRIVQLLQLYAELGRAPFRDELKDEVANVIDSMPESRRVKLKIRNPRPGRKLIESFLYRQAHELTFMKVRK